jgi:anti-sigma factor RsiW
MTPHERTLDALPWYVNGTLDAAECVGVEQHLSSCAECRTELELLRAVARVESEPDAGTLPDLASRVMGRIDAQRPSVWKNLFAPAQVWWPRLAIAELGIVLALVVSVVMLSRQLAREREMVQALAGGQQVAGNEVRLRVAFQENAPVKEMRATLDAAGAHIVSGPSAAGFYIIAAPVHKGMTPAQATAQTIALLRARTEAVLLVDEAR